MEVRVARVHDPRTARDGYRVLVDRLWPRGIKKEKLEMEAWLKDVAPSPELRKWFAHEPDKWQEFQKRYRAELEANPDAWKPILEAAKQGNVTLLYSARDSEHNSAVLLKAFLEEHV